MSTLSSISSFLFIIVGVVISCFAGLSSSSNSFNVVDNPIRLVSSDNSLPHHIQTSAFSHIPRKCNNVDSLYQFGDSLSDVGNYKSENPYSSFVQPPYGMTYFHKPTGRASDGPLLVDYMAEYFGLPFIEPYLNKSGNFKHGVNFAVIGATALNTSSHSLSVQVNWFKTHLASICSNPKACKKKISRAAFVVGEIGGNDYNFAWGKPSEFWYQMVPEIVEVISSSVEALISLGARLIFIPGNILPGCMSVYLAGSNPNDPYLHDDLKCIKYLNDLAKFHNNYLRMAITILQLKNPQTTIMYMDLEGSMRKMIQNPTTYGFDKDATLKACCGKGNDDYNFNSGTICGTEGVIACEHPEERVNWDGWHLTSRAYEMDNYQDDL